MSNVDDKPVVIVGHSKGLKKLILETLSEIDSGDVVIDYLDTMKRLKDGSSVFEFIERSDVDEGLRRFWQNYSTEGLMKILDDPDIKVSSFHVVENDFFLIKLEQ